MNIRFIPILIFVLLALSPPLKAEIGSHTHTIRFNNDDLHIADIEAEGNTYAEITLKGLHNDGEPGDPSLPWSVYSVSVPPEAVDFRVSVSGSAPWIITLDHHPMPVQYDIPTSIDYEETQFIPLATKYTRETATYPKNRAYVGGVSTIGGFNRVVTVAVTPFVWSSSNNMLAMQEEVQVTLTWRTDNTVAEKILYPGFPDMIEESMELVREAVVNPEAVGSYSTTLSRLYSQRRAVASTERVHYIIVTTKKLASSFERLAALRRMRGFESKIVCIEDILADSRFKDGDVISCLNDDAGKLRAFIKDAYTNLGTKYVLLAGKYPELPGRWVKGVNGSTFLSDLYYRDITSAWKISEKDNGVYDYTSFEGVNSDVCIGHLSTNSIVDIENYLDKLIQYEYNIKQVDLDYLNNAYVMRGHDSWINMYFDSESLPLYWTNFKKVELFDTPSTKLVHGHEVIKSMNTDYWGFVDWRSHGHYAGLETYREEIDEKNTLFYGINAYDKYPGGLVPDEKNGLDNWLAVDHPCWTLSISCELAEMGKDRECNSFMESFLFGKDYGGVSFIGNTGVGINNKSTFLDAHLFKKAVSGYDGAHRIPYASDLLRQGLIAFAPKDSVGFHVCAVKGVFGDPLVPLWTKKPIATLNPNAKGWKLLSPNATLQVVVNNLSTDKITCENDLAEGHLSERIYTNMFVAEYRSDMLPCVRPAKISNLKVYKDNYWIGGDTYFVGSPTNDYNSMSLVNGAELKMELMGIINMEGKMEVSPTSFLYIRGLKSIDLQGVELIGGGQLLIQSDGPFNVLKSISNNYEEKNALKIGEATSLTIEANDTFELEGIINIESNATLNVKSHKCIMIENAEFKKQGVVRMNSCGEVVIGNSVEFPLGVDVEFVHQLN